MVAAAFAILIVCGGPAAAGDRFAEPESCDAPRLTAPVCAAIRPWTEDQASAVLGARDVTAVADGDQLTVLARRAAGPVTLCCSIDAPLTRIGNSDIWILTARVLDLDRAIIDLQIAPAGKDLTAYYGTQVAKPVVGPRLLGTLVHETIPSAAMGEARRLTVYLPPGHDPTLRYPVVYMAGGGVVSVYAAAVEAEIISGRIRPVILIGITPGEADRQMRSREYLIGRSSPRFHSQGAFLIDELVPYATRKYGASDKPEDRMIEGFSDGGAWALAMGLRHPDVFGTIAAFSFAWPDAAAGIDSDDRPRLFLGAGLLEPDFHLITAQAARRAAASRAPLKFEDFASGHVLVAWQTMLADALAWTFPRGR